MWIDYDKYKINEWYIYGKKLYIGRVKPNEI